MSYGSRKRGLWPRGWPPFVSYNVEPVTNTSSTSCANNGRRTLRWVLDACCRSSRICFSHFATRTVDNTVDLYAAKPDIRPESRFCLPHLHSTPPLNEGVECRWGRQKTVFPSEYRHSVWYWKTRIVWLHDGEKISKMCLGPIRFDMIHERDRQTNRQTDRQTPHDCTDMSMG